MATHRSQHPKHPAHSKPLTPYVLDDESFTERTVHVEAHADGPGSPADGNRKPAPWISGALLYATSDTWGQTTTVNLTMGWRMPSDDPARAADIEYSALENVPIALLDTLAVLIPALIAKARRDGVLPEPTGGR